MRFIQQQGSLAKVRPDMKIVFIDDLPKPSARLKASARLLKQLVKLAEAA
jgi:transcription-repair coupling factor (superfamily II helicase)